MRWGKPNAGLERGIGEDRGQPRDSYRSKITKVRKLTAQELNLPDHEAAVKTLFAWLQGHEVGKDLHAVGHRLVHGGPSHVKPQRVSSALIEDLKQLIPLAPDHLPDEIKGLEAVHQLFPDLPQVALL